MASSYKVFLDGLWRSAYKVIVELPFPSGLFDISKYNFAVFAGSVETPTAPQNVSVVSNSPTSLTATWQPPISDGGTPITAYEIITAGSDIGSLIATVPATDRTYTKTALTSGREYTMSVRAINEVGTGQSTESVVTVSATNSGLPTIPLNGFVSSPSTSQATISWATPASDGGSPITGYRVSRDGTATSGTAAYSTTVSATTRSFTMNLLYPGQFYNLSVAAINSSGTGPAYTGSVNVLTDEATVFPPSIPSSVTRTSTTSSTATISWDIPATDGGSPITGYRVVRDGADGGFATTLGPLVRTYTFTGLTTGAIYNLSVIAVNAIGDGEVSVDDVTVLTGLTAPGAPTSIVITSPSTSQATISWQPPISDGGSPITGYRVSRDGTSTSGTGPYTTILAATARTFTMNILITGSEYTLSVAAINSVGQGPVAEGKITPGGSTGLPTIPLSVTRTSPSTSQATITWSAPTSDGGSAITGYRVSRDGTATTGTAAYTTVVSASTFTFTMGALFSGTTYNLSVAAINANGDGPVSKGPVTVLSDTTTVPPGATSPSGQAMPTENLPDFTLLFTDDFTVDAPLGQFLTKYPNWRAYPNTYLDTSDKGTYEPKIISCANSIMDMFVHYDSATGKFLVAAPEPRINGINGARGQKYGRYAARFRAPDKLPGYKTAWLMWPDSNLSAEGEIDFPEGDLNGTDTIRAYSHDVQGVHSHNAFAANTGVVYAGSGWHTAVFEWKPTGVTFWLDGKNLGTAPKLGTPVTAMHWILQTETDLSSVKPSTSTQGHVQVDWVAVWKYTPGSAGSTTPTNPTTPTAATPVLSSRVVGTDGGVKVSTTNASSVRLKASTDAAGTAGVVYSAAVTPDANGSSYPKLTGLTPGTRYYYRVAMKDSAGTEILDTESVVGRIRVAPTGAANFAFNFSSCCDASDSASMASIAARGDDLFIHLGDLWYADGTGVTLSNFVTQMSNKVRVANHKAVFATTPSTFTPSDHDSSMNNNGNNGSDPTALGYYNQAYRRLLPTPSDIPATKGIYYTFTWGRVQFVNLDCRSFSSDKDVTDNSSKTMLGTTQKAWLKNVITNSTARVICLMGDTSWNGSATAGDDGWDGYTTERTELSNYFNASGKNICYLGGDQHALSYDNGTLNNGSGGMVSFQASPLNNSASQKAGPWSGRYPTSGTAVVQQYGRIVVTDNGTTVTFAYTGYSSDNTSRLTFSKTW